MKEIKYKLEELAGLMPGLWKIIKPYSVIALRGNLGAGKTTFTRALCAYLGTKESASSPTFSLINGYTYKDSEGNDQLIYHSDWYRIRDAEEAVAAGIEDMLLQEDALCIIEWPEKARKLLPENVLNIYFRVEEGNSRTLIFEEA
jgi:tRNA threonylcarbamoyladenosine biosynthesis protein TsaE